MKITVTKEVEIVLPSIPNFILTEGKETQSLSAFTEAELREIGRMWTEELVLKAERIRFQEGTDLKP